MPNPRSPICFVALLLATWPQVVAAQRTGSDSEARSALAEGRALAKAGKVKDAIPSLEKAVKLAPGMAEGYDEYLKALFILRKYGKGIKVARQGLDQTSGNAVLQGQLGMHLYKAGQIKAAHVAFKKVIKDVSRRFEIQAVAAQCCLRVKDHACVEVATRSYLAHRPSRLTKNDSTFKVFLARALLEQDKTKQAEQQLEAVLKVKPGYTPARLSLAQVHVRLGKCSSAVGIFEDLRKKVSPAAFDKLRLDLGQAYLCVRRYRQALREADRFLKAAPRSLDALLLRADALFKMRRYARALAAYKRLLPLTKSSKIQIRIGQVLYLQKRYVPALKQIDAELRRGAPEPDALILGIRASIRLNKKAQAMRLAEKLLAHKNNPDHYYFAGMAHSSSGKFAAAVQLYEQALKLKARHPGALRELTRAQAYRARAAFRGARFKEAVGYMNQVLRHDPGSLVAHRNLALCHLAAGEHALALRHAKLMLKRVPNDYIGNRLAARALYKLGRQKEAQACYERAFGAVRRIGGMALAQVLAESAAVRFRLKLPERGVMELERALEVVTGNEQAFKLATQIRKSLGRVYLQRALGLLGKNKTKEAWADLQKARKMALALPAEEQLLVQVAAALGAISNGKVDQARKIMAKLKGNPGTALRPAFAKQGRAFLKAYMDFLSPSLAAKQSAAAQLEKLARRVGGKHREGMKRLAASAHAQRAAILFRQGKRAAAKKALAKAARLDPKLRRSPRFVHNQAVLTYRGAGDAGAAKLLSRVAKSTPLALCNLAVHHERKGEMQRAYELWLQCQRRGAGYPGLKAIVATKKRIFGEGAR
jgi:tetratricopeptide (TPR) repeat protein